MASRLDMSLDDLIKSNKKTTGPPRSSGPGPDRRFRNRNADRVTPYSQPIQAPETTWQHDMFVEDSAPFTAPVIRAASIETGTKLYISNLDMGVTNEDIKELFSEVGDLKRFGIHYERTGKSKGTAEVVYSRKSDAVAAVKRYNGVQLDGKPMKIEIVGTNVAIPTTDVGIPTTNVAIPTAAPILAHSAYYNANGAIGSDQGRVGPFPRPRGGGFRGRRGRGRGRGRGRIEKVSADDLDADLDNYHKEAVQTVTE